MPLPLQLTPDLFVTLPTSWAEVTLSQAQRLATTPAHDEFGLIACLLGITRIEVMNAPAAGIADVVLPALAWVTQPLDFSTLKLPETITLPIDGGDFEVFVIKVPKKLEMETFGQAVDLGNALATITDVPALRIRALAIYLYPLWSKLPYDSDAIPGFEAIVAAAKLAEAVPVADFFLQSMTASGRLTRRSSGTSPLPQLSAEQGPVSSPPIGQRWPWLTRWRRGTPANGTPSSESRGGR